MTNPTTPSFIDDRLKIGGRFLESRLFTGTGKYSDDALIPEIIRQSGSEVITVAVTPQLIVDAFKTTALTCLQSQDYIVVFDSVESQ